MNKTPKHSSLLDALIELENAVPDVEFESASDDGASSPDLHDSAIRNIMQTKGMLPSLDMGLEWLVQLK